MGRMQIVSNSDPTDEAGPPDLFSKLNLNRLDLNDVLTKDGDLKRSFHQILSKLLFIDICGVAS